MIKCIVRMEMPESCEECPLVQTDENSWGDVMSRTCNLIYKGYLSDVPKGKRREDCPIEREFVTCEDCVHEDAARRGVCMYDWDICIGGVRKENK